MTVRHVHVRVSCPRPESVLPGHPRTLVRGGRRKRPSLSSSLYRGGQDADARTHLAAAKRWKSSSGDFLPPSPPAEKTTARQDQPRQSRTGDGAGHASN
jgi:hypothetical protein